MATNVQKKRELKYLNRDFSGFKKDFIEHLKIYFPETYSDFNESSLGMMLTEMSAFIGDNLSFYLDKKFNESFLESARERKNVFKHAKQLGFKAFGKTAASGFGDAFLKVPAIKQNEKFIPDVRFAGVIRKGAKLKNSSGQIYETLENVDFSLVNINDPLYAQVADIDGTTKEPKTFILKKINVPIIAGETKTTNFTIVNYQAFKKITINEENVLEVIEVKDSSGNTWYEVDYLAQDTVFDGVANTGAALTEVPFLLTLRSVPYRFITEYNVDTRKMSLIFGTGDAQNFDGQLIPDLGDLALPTYGKSTFTDFSIDPQNFLKTRTLGLAPSNTILTIKYRSGGGANTNSGANEISIVISSDLEVSDSSLSGAVVSDVANSFAFRNPGPIQGGRDDLSLDELKQLISANFASQQRTVTAPDFIARTLSMPSKFGSIFRANAKVNPLNKNAIELIVISRDSNGFVTIAPNDLKENLKKYLSRFRMLTDAIDILDADIINIGIDFKILVNPDFNKTEVLVNCIESLKDYFAIQKWQINQPINRTDIIRTIASIPGVLSTYDLVVSNKIGNSNPEGLSYSNTVYNLGENFKNNIYYCRENAIFEVKYLNKNIRGVAK
jgi:hypothetical protein